MMPAEILERYRIDDRSGGRAEASLEQMPGVWARSAVHAIEQHAKAAAKKPSQGFEIEQLEKGYMKGAPKFGGFLCRGVAKRIS